MDRTGPIAELDTDGRVAHFVLAADPMENGLCMFS